MLLKGYADRVCAVAFDNEGVFLATASQEELVVQLWDMTELPQDIEVTHDQS